MEDKNPVKIKNPLIRLTWKTKALPLSLQGGQKRCYQIHKKIKNPLIKTKGQKLSHQIYSDDENSPIKFTTTKALQSNLQ